MLSSVIALPEVEVIPRGIHVPHLGAGFGEERALAARLVIKARVRLGFVLSTNGGGWRKQVWSHRRLWIIMLNSRRIIGPARRLRAAAEYLRAHGVHAVKAAVAVQVKPKRRINSRFVRCGLPRLSR